MFWHIPYFFKNNPTTLSLTGFQQSNKIRMVNFLKLAKVYFQNFTSCISKILKRRKLVNTRDFNTSDHLSFFKLLSSSKILKKYVFVFKNTHVRGCSCGNSTVLDIVLCWYAYTYYVKYLGRSIAITAPVYSVTFLSQ